MILNKITFLLLISSAVYSQKDSINLTIWNKDTEKWFSTEIIDTLSTEAITFPVPMVYNDSTIVNNLFDEFKQLLYKRNYYIEYINSIAKGNLNKIYIVERFYYNSPNEITVFIGNEKYYEFELNDKNKVCQTFIEKDKEKVIDEYNYWFKSQFYGFNEWRSKQSIGDLIIATEIDLRKNKNIIQFIKF